MRDIRKLAKNPKEMMKPQNHVTKTPSPALSVIRNPRHPYVRIHILQIYTRSLTTIVLLSRHTSNHICILARRIAQTILALLQPTKAIQHSRHDAISTALIRTSFPVHCTTKALVLDICSFDGRFSGCIV